MINDDIQKQQSGDNSVNYQAHGNISIVYGITKENAKEELLQIFKENMPVIKKMAFETINKSAEELIDFLLEEIIKFEEDLQKQIFQRMSEPDMQIAIFEAQKNYARYPDDDKLKLFTKLLIAKGKEERKSLRNILLDDAITTITKMNQLQIDFLSYQVLKTAIPTEVYSVQDLYEKYIKKCFIFDNIFGVLTYSSIDYLDQLACIKRRPYKIVDQNISDKIKKYYSIKLGQNLEHELCEIDTKVAELIRKDSSIPPIDLNPLGVLIGLQNIEIKTGNVLNWDFN